MSQNSGDWGHTEGTLPDIADLARTGPEPDPVQIREQVLRDLGHRTARRPTAQIEGSDPGAVADLRSELGI